jgi:hypothetical protein
MGLLQGAAATTNDYFQKIGCMPYMALGMRPGNSMHHAGALVAATMIELFCSNAYRTYNSTQTAYLTRVALPWRCHSVWCQTSHQGWLTQCPPCGRKEYA